MLPTGTTSSTVPRIYGIDVDAAGNFWLNDTFNQRILKYIRPDHVHILMDGRIVRSGGAELALELEQSGYAGVAPQQEV